MEWMEALLLECQVSVQDFSSAVEMIIKEKFMKVGWFIATHCIVASVYKFILNITLGDLYIA